MTIRPDDELVTMTLQPAALTADTYRAALRSAPGDEFWMQSRLKLDEQRILTLTIPATMLQPGDYELGVQGVPPVPKRDPVFYYFAVTRSP
jgi:hypothetical protein